MSHRFDDAPTLVHIHDQCWYAVCLAAPPSVPAKLSPPDEPRVVGCLSSQPYWHLSSDRPSLSHEAMSRSQVDMIGRTALIRSYHGVFKELNIPPSGPLRYQRESLCTKTLESDKGNVLSLFCAFTTSPFTRSWSLLGTVSGLFSFILCRRADMLP